MYNNHHWSIDSWGNGYPPVNAEEIIARANDIIDGYIDANPDISEWELQEFCSQLWEEFCSTDALDGIEAIYD